jgi:hypothetical protein
MSTKKNLIQETLYIFLYWLVIMYLLWFQWTPGSCKHSLRKYWEPPFVELSA